MKVIFLAIISLIVNGLSYPQVTTNEPIKLFFDGMILSAEHLEKGPLNYFVSHQFEERIVALGSNSFQRERIKVERYFLGTKNQIDEITPENYKDLVIKYLPNAPELHKRLGKRGFRFENVRYMVQFYNNFKS